MLEALIAAFSCLEKSLSCLKKVGWLVGAVVIELRAGLQLIDFHRGSNQGRNRKGANSRFAASLLENNSKLVD
jgi:hypothetical protein